MQPKYNKQLVPLAKQLRKEMTKEEDTFGMIFCESIPCAFPDRRFWGSILQIFTALKQSL